MRRTILWAALTVLALAGGAVAQPAEPEGGDKAPIGEPATKPAEPAKGAEQKPAGPKGSHLGKPLTEEDESVYVVQKRTYSTGGKHALSLMYGTTINNKFTGHQGVALSYGYHLKEALALEAMVGWMWGRFTTMTNELRIQEDLRPEDVALKQMGVGGDPLPSFGLISIHWSPIYGKLRLIGGVLGDFDLFLMAGGGYTKTQEECTLGETLPDGSQCAGDVPPNEWRYGDNLFDADAKLAGMFGGGFRFYFLDWLGVRAEVRDILYSDRVVKGVSAGVDEAPGTTTDIRNNFFVFLGLSLLL